VPDSGRVRRGRGRPGPRGSPPGGIAGGRRYAPRMYSFLTLRRAPPLGALGAAPGQRPCEDLAHGPRPGYLDVGRHKTRRCSPPRFAQLRQGCDRASGANDLRLDGRAGGLTQPRGQEPGRPAHGRAGLALESRLGLLPEELADVTEILDLRHALASLWEATHLFHPNGSDAARAFVKAQARCILHGEVAAVIHSLRWLATHHNLKGERRKTLERICGHFHTMPNARPTTSTLGRASRSPPVSSKEPAGVSSKTAWNVPESAGSCPAPAPCSTCVAST